MSSVLLAPLNELHSLSHTLFLSLSPIQSKPPPAPPLSSFLACDEALSAAINLARKHQIRQRRIDALEQEILESDARWREIVLELENGRKELEEVIEEGGERIKAIEQAKNGMISDTILPVPQTFKQHRYLILNFLLMRRALARSHLHRQTCPISVYQASLLLSSFHLFRTKKRCAVVISTRRHH